MLALSSRALWSILIILIGLAFGCLELQQSLREGLLAFPPIYDNNGYLIEALTYTQSLYDDGFSAFFFSLFHRPPHAPIATALAIAGFILFGIRDWTPNLAQLVEPVVLLFIVDRLARECPLILRLAVMIAVLCVPINGYLIQEDRPDVFWGVLIAGGAALSVSLEAIREQSTRRWAGVLLGLAVLSKPSIILINCAMIGAILILVLALNAKNRDVSHTSALRLMLDFLLPIFLIPLPYFIVGGREVANYIFRILFSPEANSWLLAQPGPLWSELTYYTFGPAGQMMIANGLYFSACCAIFSGSLALYKRDEPALFAGVMFVILLIFSYSIISFPQLKSGFFGAGFYYLVIFGATRAIFYVAGYLKVTGRSWTTSCMAALLILITLPTFKFASSYGQVFSTKTPKTTGQDWYATLNEIISLVANPDVKNGLVYITAPFYFINEHTLGYINGRDEISKRISFLSLYRSNELGDYLKLFDRADGAIAVNPGVAGSNLVPESIQNELLDRLRDDRLYTSIKHITFDGLAIGEIYVRTAPFLGFTPETGWSPEEALPPSQSSRSVPVHWGIAPRTDLRIRFPASGHLILNASATRPDATTDDLPIFVNGHQEGILSFRNGATEDSVLLTGTPGDAILSLPYTTWLEPKGPELRKLAVLFRRLQLKDAP